MLESTYAATLSQFETLLGNPDGDGPLSFAKARERDESETYPHEAIQALSEIGAHLLQIPTRHGGRQGSLEDLLAASYAVGRRDPAVDLSFGLQMWSQLIWLAGSPEQQREVAELLHQNVGVSLAASEAGHGADLLSSECSAAWNGREYLLSGEKWPIGCATVCRLAFVLARTSRERGARSLSWFMLGPDELSCPSCERMNKVPTLGMRASDLSGFRFSSLSLSPSRMIGKRGSGLELALLLFQLTRPLVASLCFGPGDTAVRIAVQFALCRYLYGKIASDLPTVRRSLVVAWIDLMIAEIAGVVAVREAHVDPGGLCVGSLVAKIIVPYFVRHSIEESARVLGARFFMRDYHHGVFGKMYRDQSVIGILDGSTEVCAQSLAAWLPLLLGRAKNRSEEQLTYLCDPCQTVPALSYERLQLAPRGPSLLLEALEDLVQSRGDQYPAYPAVLAISRYVGDELRRLAEKVRSLRVNSDQEISRAAEMVDMAHSYARVQTLAACLAFCVVNQNADLITERPSWLWMVARRLCPSLVGDSQKEQVLVDDLFDNLKERTQRHELLSALHSARGLYG